MYEPLKLVRPQLPQNDGNMYVIIIRLLRIAGTKATRYINREKIRIHNYAKIQHILKIQIYYTNRNIIMNFVGNDGESVS